MRFRLAEIMAGQGLNAYGLAKRLEGKMNRSSVYRLANGGKVKLSADEVGYLCDVLRVEPGELFERDSKRGGKR